MSDGDQFDISCVNQLVAKHGRRLERLIALRMDARLRGRVGVSDVLQETMIEAARRIKELQESDVSDYVWLRFLACQKLIQFRRKHLNAACRSVEREVSLNRSVGPAASSKIMAIQLIDNNRSPDSHVISQERSQQLAEAVEAMELIDREVIALRHYEQLSNEETARLLGISADAAYKRYVRALKRLKEILSG